MMLGHVTALAADDKEGRAPGTAGEERTVAYLVGQFNRLGLAPGNPDGTYSRPCRSSASPARRRPHST